MKKETKILGLQRKKVKLLAYSPKWEKLFEAEKKRLCSAIGKYALNIQHVGSTAISGMRAKPIIDIAVGVESLDIGKKCVKPLEKLGYEYKHEAGVKGRHFFAKGPENNRTHYVHIEKLGSRPWQNHVLFRDYLCAHKKAVRKYSLLKEKLAKKYKNDRDTYTAKKHSFIEKIIKVAKRETRK